MRPSVILNWCFPFLFISFHKGLGVLRWRVGNKLFDYGQNLELLCNVSNCCFQASGWDIWSPERTQIFKDIRTVNTSASGKYSGEIYTDGFTLIISNLSEDDVNVSYSCSYGLQMGKAIFLHESAVFSRNDIAAEPGPYPNGDQGISHTDKSELSDGVIAVIVIAVLVLIIVLLGLGMFKVITCSESGTFSKDKNESTEKIKFTVCNKSEQKIEVSFVSPHQNRQTTQHRATYGGFALENNIAVLHKNPTVIDSGKSFEFEMTKEYIGCNIEVKYNTFFLHFIPTNEKTTLQHKEGKGMVFTKENTLEYES